MDAKNLAELRFLGPGFNWMKIQGIIAVGMSGYNSPLPQGTTVSVTTFDPGAACMDGPLLVAEGKFHTAITTPPWFSRMAIDGKGYFSSPLPVRALARFPHFDQLALAVKKSTGVNSFGELIEKRYPLRISTAPSNHPAYWVTDQIFQAYGCRFEDVGRWGGTVSSEERQKGRLDALRSNQVDAVFDEALMTQRWKVITDEIDFHFLPVEEHALVHCERMGMKRTKAIDRKRVSTGTGAHRQHCSQRVLPRYGDTAPSRRGPVLPGERIPLEPAGGDCCSIEWQSYWRAIRR